MAAEYPKIWSPLQLLEDSDDESIFCGPVSARDDSGRAESIAMRYWLEDDYDWWVSDNTTERSSLIVRDHKPKTSKPKRISSKSMKVDLLKPGSVQKVNPKFICVVPLGVEDDEEFCLVKRLLGKGGCNMRTIADECDAKLRLRGIGSGFLEGPDNKEATFPLQISVSCSDINKYFQAVRRVSELVSELYKHYRRYMKSKGMQIPDLSLELQEVRRDDLDIDVLAEKAARTPSQRDRDRRNRREAHHMPQGLHIEDRAATNNDFESGRDRAEIGSGRPRLGFVAGGRVSKDRGRANRTSNQNYNKTHASRDDCESGSEKNLTYESTFWSNYSPHSHFDAALYGGDAISTSCQLPGDFATPSTWRAASSKWQHQGHGDGRQSTWENSKGYHGRQNGWEEWWSNASWGATSLPFQRRGEKR